MNQEPIKLNKDALDQIRQLERRGQPSILNQVIDAYLEASPAVFAALLAGVQDADAKSIQFNAHTLKSGSASLGAVSFSKLCLRLEKIGQSGATGEASILMETLCSDFPRVCEALARERILE